MKQLISLFEIPATDFDRAVSFYEHVLGVEMTRCECGEEKMAFFPDPETGPRGAVSLAKGFEPSTGGVLVSLSIENIDEILRRVVAAGGTIHIPKTPIEAEGQGSFAVFNDPEGNRIGLHSLTEMAS
jgi:predicted enzyme related to lactoylglutathione lyase